MYMRSTCFNLNLNHRRNMMSAQINFVLLGMNHPIYNVFPEDVLLRKAEKDSCHAGGNVEHAKKKRA